MQYSQSTIDESANSPDDFGSWNATSERHCYHMIKQAENIDSKNKLQSKYDRFQEYMKSSNGGNITQQNSFKIQSILDSALRECMLKDKVNFGKRLS